MIKALFLDRDGIINKMIKKLDPFTKKIIDDSPFKVSELKMVPESKELVKKAKEKGYKVIIITNQPSIVKGQFSLKDYEDITTEICKYLELKRGDVFECLHKEGITLECNCRKPKPGLFLMAKGIHDIDLTNSIMIGDSWKDIKAAKDIGIGKTIFIKRKESKEQVGNADAERKMKELNLIPTHFCDNLKETITLI
ncbi:MAG TPA: HAD-IIIA family hydrolase [Candidatus Nanoarchaeia archaeon]|nr:HAD-IIIA family hydrolase [Candidatus Nanoarchaeia archaeon]